MDRDNTTTAIFWPVEGRDVTPGKVRMDMPVAGIRFKTLQNDPRGKSEMQFVIKLDLSGMIPTWVMSQALGWSANGLLAFRKLTDKYFK